MEHPPGDQGGTRTINAYSTHEATGYPRRPSGPAGRPWDPFRAVLPITAPRGGPTTLFPLRALGGRHEADRVVVREGGGGSSGASARPGPGSAGRGPDAKGRAAARRTTVDEAGRGRRSVAAHYPEALPAFDAALRHALVNPRAVAGSGGGVSKAGWRGGRRDCG